MKAAPTDAAAHDAVPPVRVELRALARFAAPLATAQAAVILMSVVDTLFVGRYDATHLAGVGVGNALSHGIFVFGMGVALVLEPLVALDRKSVV